MNPISQRTSRAAIQRKLQESHVTVTNMHKVNRFSMQEALSPVSSGKLRHQELNFVLQVW